MIQFNYHHPTLKKIQRRQAVRFGVPALVFVLLMGLLVAAVYYAQQDEREGNQAKLIADTLWARQNIQFQMESLTTPLHALANDSLIYYSSKLPLGVSQLIKSSGELIAVFKDKDLETVSYNQNQLKDVDLQPIVNQIKTEVDQRVDSRLGGFIGPFVRHGRPYIASVGIGLHGSSVIVGIIDLGLLLDKELPWWFAQDNEVELLDAGGSTLVRQVKGKSGLGIYVHTTSLDLGGLPFQLRVNSGSEGPKLFNYGITAALAFLLVLLAISFFMLWRDSRKRLQIEASLEEERQFRQSMQDSMAVGLRVWGLDGVIRYVNPAFCKMVGYAPEELIDRPQPLPYWPVNNTESYRQLVERVMAGNAPPEGFETVYHHKDGRLLDVLIVEAPLKDTHGNQVGWMSSVIDITDRKKSEALVAEQREKLQAASRFALVGEVASNIAHELNQPLATMVSFAQAGMNLSQRGGNVEMYVQLFEKLRDQAQRAGRVVGSVQNLVRKRKPMREQVRLGDIIESVRFSVNSLAVKYRVNLQFDLGDPALVLSIDRIMVEQALVNLVKNASEAFYGLSENSERLGFGAGPRGLFRVGCPR